jgi:hypothetical protein
VQVFATYRLDQTETDRVARTLSAWSLTSNATVAAMTALSGLLASIPSPHTAFATAGVLLLAIHQSTSAACPEPHPHTVTRR